MCTSCPVQSSSFWFMPVGEELETSLPVASWSSVPWLLTALSVCHCCCPLLGNEPAPCTPAPQVLCHPAPSVTLASQQSRGTLSAGASRLPSRPEPDPHLQLEGVWGSQLVTSPRQQPRTQRNTCVTSSASESLTSG